MEEADFMLRASPVHEVAMAVQLQVRQVDMQA